VTIEAFDSLCLGAKEILDSEVSPNGEWLAATCYWENGKEDSPLQVVNTDHTKEWKIYFRDFVKGNVEYGRKNIIVPYRWSKDGRFLYVVSPTIASGCCWIGGQYVLLIRINLEAGLQEELISTIDPRATLPVSFAISENDHYLLFTPVTQQQYDFAVLDLFSGKSRVVILEEKEPIDLEFAIMSPYDDIIVLPIFKNIEYNDYVVVSLLVVDLKSNQQRVLVSDLKDGEELYPIRWIDGENILVSSANPNLWYEKQSAEYWSIDINTGKRESVENP
jgi:hypothetical protein